LLVLGPANRLKDVAVRSTWQQDDPAKITAEILSGREVVAGRLPLLGAEIRAKPVRQRARTVDAAPDRIDLTQARLAERITDVRAAKGMPDIPNAVHRLPMQQEHRPQPNSRSRWS
jgi:hypothetical protein